MAVFDESFPGGSSGGSSGSSDRAGFDAADLDTEHLDRWVSLLGGGVLALYGLRRGTIFGLLMALAGGRIAWRAAMEQPRGLLATLPGVARGMGSMQSSARQPSRSRATSSAKATGMGARNGSGTHIGYRRNPEVDDLVNEAGDESFPASDPPSWTPTTAGSTKRG